MKHISISPVTITGNRGSESMLASTIFELRKRKKISFEVFSYYPDDDKRINKKSYVNIHSSEPLYLMLFLFPACLLYRLFVINLKFNFLKSYLPESVTSLAKSEYLIDLAGVSFIDGREKFLPYNVLSVLPALLVKTKVVKFSQAMGPFQNPANKLLARLILGRCEMTYCRGQKTVNHLNQLGIDKKRYAFAPDIAFLLGSNYALANKSIAAFERDLSKIKSQAKKKKLVGICPSAVIYKKNGSEYIEFLKAMASQLSDRDYSVVVFPNASRNSDKLFNNDLLVIDKLKKYFENNDNVLFISYCIGASQIRKIIQKCNFTVVSRLHAMVATLALEKVPVVIGWSHKYEEIMHEFGLHNFVVEYNEIDAQKMTRLIQEASILKLGRDFQKNLEKTKKEALKQITYIVNRIT